MITHWLARNISQRSQLFFGLVRFGTTRQPRPLIANLFITERCNARCLYCYVADVNRPDGTPETQRRMSGPEWLDLIDRLIDRGVRYFTLVGGEPMVSSDCAAIINHLYRRNVFFNLTTNGSLVPTQLDLVRKVSQLTISLDGDETANDTLRGVGWHARAMKAIDAAIGVGVPVRINTVITKANRDQIGSIVALCEARNLFVTFSPCIDAPEFRQAETRKWMLDDKDVKAFFTDLLAWKQRTNRIMNSNTSIQYMIDYPTDFERVVMRDDPEASYYEVPCTYGRIQYHFSEFGEVFPCGIWWNRPDYTAQTVFDGGLDAAIANASDRPCQYCSFCNRVDWDEMTRPRSLLKGIDMTVRQALGARSNLAAQD